ncbi:MAG: hypothetical protein WAV05_01705 [Anaerolineales bacterium]
MRQILLHGNDVINGDGYRGDALISRNSNQIFNRLCCSARFSPSGDLLAFALAQGNPDNERGWVAVGDSTGGASKLVLAGDAGSYYSVLGWLDDQTLLVQANTLGNPNVGSQLFTVGADGSNLTKVADGSLLTIIDNR